MRIAPRIDLTKEQRRELQRLVNGRRTEVRVVMRARIVLAASRDLENKEIASELGVNRETVGRWRSRFAEEGIEGILKDLPRGGRKPTARSRVEGRIIRGGAADQQVFVVRGALQPATAARSPATPHRSNRLRSASCPGHTSYE